VIGQIEGGFIPVPGDTDDQREDWWRRKERKLERPFLDELLALGDRRSRGSRSEPLYALGLLHEDRKRRRKELSFPEEPPAALRDRDAADAVADLLYALGLREVVVAPVWPDFIREVLDGPEAVSAHVTELTRLIDSRQTVTARGAARAGQSRRSPQPI
jgi:hypothetical protein